MSSKATIRLKKALDETLSLVSKENQPLVSDVLTKVVIDCLDKFQKKVNVGLQDSITDLLDQFKRDIQKEIFEIGQNWTLATRNEKFLLPNNCRFVSSKGLSTIVVIEQEPMRRSLTIDRGLLGTNTLATRTNQTTRVSLLFPYVLFVLQWKNNRLANAYTAWRKEPIRQLTDDVFNPIVPNTHDNYAICTGDINIPNGDISSGVENVISDYWQSIFNTDLATFWWEKARIPQISTVEIWEENSDDAFLFNDINLRSKNKTLEEMIDFCCLAESDPNSVELRKRLSDTIETCSIEMFNKLIRYFKKTGFERFYPKDVQESVVKSMETILNEICDIVLALEQDLQSISKTEKSHGWKPCSPCWR